MTSPFIAPRYEVPLTDNKTGRISLEWYKFLVPLAKKAVSSDITINTDAPLEGGAALVDDVTLSIASNGITNALLAQMPSNTIKGNNAGVAANAQDLTAAQATAILNTFTDVLKGLVPASGGTSNYLLRSDGTFTDQVGGAFTATTYLRTGAVLVANLPAAATAGVGSRHMVTDATSTTFNNIVAGTGANTVPVFSDGTNWRIG